MKKKSVFKIGFMIYLLVAAALCTAFLVYVWNTMLKYESMQPEGAMERFVAEITVEDMDFTKVEKPSEFEDENILVEQMRKKLDGATLHFKQREGSYDAKAPVFDVYDEEDLLYTVTLGEVREIRMMFILSASEWEITSVIPNVTLGEYTVDITVPDNYRVTVNGISLNTVLHDGVTAPIKELEYSAEYTEVPGLVSYHIDRLINQPELEVFDRRGAKVDVSDMGNRIVIDSFPTEEIPEELKEYVLDAAKTYSNFFSRDLEGCERSTKPIRHLFPEDSYYLEMAENYRRHDMWMYSGHNAPAFDKETVENYTVYSDCLFSCEISFEKTMTLLKGGGKRVDTVHDIYYFVKIDGDWLIADIQAVIN